MNTYFILLPTVILLSSLIAYIILKQEVKSYLRNLKWNVEIKYRIMNLAFLKDMVSFYSDSKTSHITEDILDHLTIEIETNAETLTKSAMEEVEILHRRLNAIRYNSRNYYVVETLYWILINLVVVYGISVALVQYVLLYTISSGEPSLYLALVNTLLAGATIVFGSVVGLILFQIFRKTKWILDLSGEVALPLKKGKTTYH